jgi:hypothetical protein
MGNIFNPDFRDFLVALNENEVEYMLVGGYSVILHGHSRTTGDLDVWVNKTKSNYKKLTSAFNQFKMPVFDMTEANFLHNPLLDVFMFGKPPVSIEILIAVKGLDFAEAFKNKEIKHVEGINVCVIGFNDLRKAKESAGRNRDLDDLENLK